MTKPAAAARAASALLMLLALAAGARAQVRAGALRPGRARKAAVRDAEGP
jgi:hypothetical protein